MVDTEQAGVVVDSSKEVEPDKNIIELNLSNFDLPQLFSFLIVIYPRNLSEQPNLENDENRKKIIQEIADRLEASASYLEGLTTFEDLWKNTPPPNLFHFTNGHNMSVGNPAVESYISKELIYAKDSPLKAAIERLKAAARKIFESVGSDTEPPTKNHVLIGDSIRDAFGKCGIPEFILSDQIFDSSGPFPIAEFINIMEAAKKLD